MIIIEKNTWNYLFLVNFSFIVNLLPKHYIALICSSKLMHYSRNVCLFCCFFLYCIELDRNVEFISLSHLSLLQLHKLGVATFSPQILQLLHPTPVELSKKKNSKYQINKLIN